MFDIDANLFKIKQTLNFFKVKTILKIKKKLFSKIKFLF